MKSIVQFTCLIALVALLIPGIIAGGRMALPGGAAKEQASRPAASAPTASRAERNVKLARAERAAKSRPRPGRAIIRADARGHFVTKAKLNGKSVDVLVDTGASTVALNRTLAKRLGIRLKDKDFKHTAKTANGRTSMAIATLKSVRIGGVTVRNVEAAVLSDASLDGVLLGMSFLGQLKSFSVRNGELKLVR